jgi:hypothetical protein
MGQNQIGQSNNNNVDAIFSARSRAISATARLSPNWIVQNAIETLFPAMPSQSL